jgi:hypothetical protein
MHFSAIIPTPNGVNRIQGKIANLPPQQRAQVDSWLREGLVYTEIARRIKTVFGVSIGTNSLSRYYSKNAEQILSNIQELQDGLARESFVAPPPPGTVMRSKNGSIKN